MERESESPAPERENFTPHAARVNGPGDTAGTARSRAEQRKGRLQVVLVVGVLLAGIATNVLLSSGSSKPRQRTSGADTLLVDTMAPLIRDTRVRIVETGVIQARNSIALSPQVGGRVVMASPGLASGGFFQAGEVLFRIDPADYRAAVERARADLATARAELQVELAEADVARQEWNLVHPGEPIPPLVAREPQISQVRASVQSAEAALKDAELDLSRVDFSFPFDGRIVSTTIEVGQNLSASQSYGDAYDVNSIEISTPLSTNVLEAIAPAVGRRAIVRERSAPFNDPAAYPARVVRADAELDPETRLARIVLEFERQTPLLPGTFVEVEIEGPVVEGAHLVPERAVSESRVIWVVEGGRLAARRPRLFALEEGLVITAPFDAADGVVTTPLVEAVEGSAVTVAGAANGDT